MDTKTNTTPGDALSLTCLGLFLLATLVLFAYQIANYTTLLG